MADLFRGAGGYRWLDSFVMGTIIQLGTHRFCEKFLTRQIDPTGRQYDLMTQAARSGCMNNVEGSERGATSKETEMRLTDVAPWLDSDDDAVMANVLIILIARTINMLNHQLGAQGEKFVQEGGFREQLKDVRSAELARREDAPQCPECGAPMRKRTAKSGKSQGKPFWGCSGYPKCSGTREVEK